MKTDINTERDLLIAMLNSEDSLADAVASLSADHFAYASYGRLFAIMKQMMEAQEPVNLITIAPHLRNIGDVSLKELMRPTISNKKSVDYLVGQVKDYCDSRKTADIITAAKEKLEHGTAQAVLTETTDKLFAMTIDKGEEELITGKELAVRAITHVQNRVDAEARKGRLIYTSFTKLNQITGGFEGGQLIILSGKTKSGKSAFCQNLMSAISVRQTIPCLYVNSEMSEEQMSLRWAAMLTGDQEITHSKLRAGDLTPEQVDTVSDGLNRLYKSQFNCLTMPDLQVDKVIQVLRRYVVRYGIRVAAVDYIGRMDMVKSKSDIKDWQLLFNAAQRLKTIAQQLNIVVFMVAQLTDTGTLQQARYMENECDLHLVVKKMEESEVDACRARCEPWNYRLIVANARSCETGSEMKMQFNGEKLTFIGES